MNKLPDEIQNELISYMNKKNINNIFNHIAESLLLNKPDNPIRFIIQYLINEYPDETIGVTICILLI